MNRDLGEENAKNGNHLKKKKEGLGVEKEEVIFFL